MAQLDPVTWFRSAHPEQGSLRVQVSAARGIFPIPGVAVEVYRDFGAVRETFYSGVPTGYCCRRCPRRWDCRRTRRASAAPPIPWR